MTDSTRTPEPLTAEEEALIRDFARYDGEGGSQTLKIQGDLWGRPGVRRLLATLDAARAERREQGDGGLNRDRFREAFRVVAKRKGLYARLTAEATPEETTNA